MITLLENWIFLNFHANKKYILKSTLTLLGANYTLPFQDYSSLWNFSYLQPINHRRFIEYLRKKVVTLVTRYYFETFANVVVTSRKSTLFNFSNSVILEKTKKQHYIWQTLLPNVILSRKRHVQNERGKHERNEKNRYSEKESKSSIL